MEYVKKCEYAVECTPEKMGSSWTSRSVAGKLSPSGSHASCGTSNYILAELLAYEEAALEIIVAHPERASSVSA